MTLRRLFKCIRLSILTLLMASLLSSCFVYLDETIIEGKGYGLEIGMSKFTVFGNITNIYEDNARINGYKMEENASEPYISQNIRKIDFSSLEKANYWLLYFDNNPFDSLSLTFKNDSLVKIYRHKKNFELP